MKSGIDVLEEVVHVVVRGEEVAGCLMLAPMGRREFKPGSWADNNNLYTRKQTAQNTNLPVFPLFSVGKFRHRS